MSTAQRILGFFLPLATLWQRELVRFYRERNRIIGALGTPLVFWLLIGSGLGASFRPPSAPDTNYLEYFFPGAMLMILLFTAIFSTISIIEDRREGFLQSVLVAPVSRSSLVLGKTLGGTTLALLQGLIFLLLAPLVGISLRPPQLIFLVAILFIIAFGLTALGFLLAWQMDSTQSFHAIMNLLLFPMWLLSGAAFPASGAPLWLRWVMWFDPLTYGMAALRRCLYPSQGYSDLPSLSLSLLVTVLFCLFAFAASIVVASRRTIGDLG